MINKLIRKKKEVGLKNLVIGVMKLPYYRGLQRKYQFDPWHLTPFELREYVQAVARYVNSRDAKYVVDIGCGLGELLRHIKAEKRLGMDLQGEAIRAANHLHCATGIAFKKGSFDELGTGQDIDYLITLGFMHGSPHEVWKPAYCKVCEGNNIRHVIVDSTKTTEDSYRLDFSQILPPEYRVCDTFGPFLGERYIYVYEKIPQNH